MNNTNKRNNNNKNNFIVTRRRRVRRGNKVNNKYTRIYRPRPTTFGPGSQFIILSRIVSLRADTIQVYSLNNALNSLEWGKVEFDFMFFKVDRIALIFLPRVYPISDNQDCLYVNINYTAKQIEAPSIQDNTQMISPYLPKPKMIIYRVPHVSVDGIVLNSWLDHGDFIEMTNKINFTMSSPDNITGWNFRLEMGVKCRLPTNPEETKKYEKQYVNINKEGVAKNTTDYKEVFSQESIQAVKHQQEDQIEQQNDQQNQIKRANSI